MEDVGFVQTDERAISAPRGDGAASGGRARVYARRSERIVRARTLREPQGAVCDLAVLKQLALSLYAREAAHRGCESSEQTYRARKRKTQLLVKGGITHQKGTP